MTLATLKDLFVHELSDLLDAEKQLIKALPRMAKAASSEDLREAFEEHGSQTREQVRRLEDILKSQDTRRESVVCKGMKGLLDECDDAINGEGDPAVMDALLISTAQRIEHYEMAGYGCARAFAELLGEESNAILLQATLDEEKAADRKLTEVAEREINLEAAHT